MVCEEPARKASSEVTESYDLPTTEGITQSIAPGFLSVAREGTPVDLQRRLAGDLDSILSKVLEKKPEDRYRSAEQFSSDLERHLSGKRILATRAGRFTQLAHVFAQHKAAILAMVILSPGLRHGQYSRGAFRYAVLCRRPALDRGRAPLSPIEESEHGCATRCTEPT